MEGKIKIEGLVAKGGMGAVYRAHHLLVDKPVAVKVLAQELDQTALARFQQEGKTGMTLVHPGIAQVHDFGVNAEGKPYLVMDWVEGTSLSTLLKQGPLEEQRALRMMMQMCDALQYAHEKGFVHRDIKPGNIMICDGDVVKIIDFGIAKSITNGTGPSITQTGEVIGSPTYMSPEQCSGLPADARSDVYALGCTLYEMLTGKPPFAGDNVMQVMMQHANEIPKTITVAAGKKFLPGCAEVVARCLEKAPDDRFANVHELRLQLQLVHDGCGSASVSRTFWRNVRRRMPLIAMSVFVLCGVAYGINVYKAKGGSEPRQAAAVVASAKPSRASQVDIYYRQLGAEFERVGKYNEASEQYEHAIELFERAGDVAHASEFKSLLTPLVPRLAGLPAARAMRLIGQLDQSIFELDKQIVALEAAQPPDYGTLAYAYAERAMAYQRRKTVDGNERASADYSSAIAAFDKAPNARTDSIVNVFAHLGRLQVEEKRFSEANKTFQQAVAIRTKDPSISFPLSYLYRGLAESNRGNSDKLTAAKYYRLAISEFYKANDVRNARRCEALLKQLGE